jgi:hypothetical protein
MRRSAPPMRKSAAKDAGLYLDDIEGVQRQIALAMRNGLLHVLEALASIKVLDALAKRVRDGECFPEITTRNHPRPTPQKGDLK